MKSEARDQICELRSNLQGSDKFEVVETEATMP